MLLRTCLFIFDAGSRRLGPNNFRNSSYKEKPAGSARVSRLSLRFLWLCFDGLNWYLFAVFISFSLKKILHLSMFMLKPIDNTKAAAVGQPLYYLKIFGHFFTYFHNNLGQEITWCWCSLELEGLLVVIGSCNGVAEIDNGCSANLLSWVSDISKSTFPISLDNRETSANVEQAGSSTLLDENGESRWCSGSDGIFCSCSFSGWDF